MKFCAGLSDIAAQYDGFIVDLWGVIHDGVAPYPGALDCLSHLRGRPVLLLSNAPRRAKAAQHTLRELGVPDCLYTSILTSGEATWCALRDRTDPWFARLGNRAYHIGPQRDRNVIEGLDIQRVEAPEAATFLLNTGPDDTRDPTSLTEFLAELAACRAAGLKMICANPDLEVMRGGDRLLCAGALAEHYASIGGEVRSLGKPDPAIYDVALNMLGVPRARVLAIGDSLRTDIAGAANAGIDSAWIIGGIHGESLGADRGLIEAAAQRAGLSPVAVLDRLSW
jgi:HAD superfamily hydrolase (TIGR01459 family)